MTKKQKPPEFEKALERLEEIVGEMEGGELGLDDMIARFEEGQKLIKLCTGKLDEVERRIEKLVEKDGELIAEPLESGPGAEPPSEEPEELF